MATKNIKLVEWYYNSGVTDIISNTSRSYLKDDEEQVNESSQDKAPCHSISPQNTLARKIANHCSTLSELKKAVQNFEGCALKDTSMNTVFSDGNQNAEIMLIGEAPGANEDAKGIPFCGESGQLLDKVLGTIDLNRASNVYISNVIFWRPPGNRKPTDEELMICLPFVEKHIALASPKFLIISGGVALYSLFGISTSISQYRQKILKYKNQYMFHEIPATVIYHPSYLLRQPLQKKLAWEDMIFIKKFLSKK